MYTVFDVATEQTLNMFHVYPIVDVNVQKKFGLLFT